MAETVGSIKYTLDLDDTKFKQGLGQAKGDVQGLGGHMHAAAGASKGLLVGLAGLTAGAVAFGGLSLKAFTESQDSIAQLDAVLKSTGKAAGVTKDQALGLASSLQSVTKFSDEAILGGENMLLTFTKIGKDIFPEATETMLNMSQALGQDVKASAIQLGKALNDPIQGVTALRRVGVTFNDEQQKVIQTMVESGDLMGAQKLILKELQTEFGGSARAAGKTFAGQMIILKNTFGDAMEAIGQGISQFLGPLIDKFREFIGAAGGAEGIINRFKMAWQALQPFMIPIVTIIVAMLVPAFVALAASVWAAISPLLPFIAIGAAVGLAIKLLIDAVGGLDVVLGALKLAWELLSPPIMQLWTVIKTQLWPALKQLWDLIAPVLMPILKVLAIVIGVTLVGGLYVAINVLKIIIQVITWLVQKIVEVINWFKNMYNSVKDTFGKIVPAIKEALSGVWDAITSPFTKAFDSVKDGVGGVVDKLKNLNPFSKHSPSLVELVTKGTTRITDLYGNMFGSIGKMSAQLTPTMPPAVSAPVLNGGNLGSPKQITVNQTNNNYNPFDLESANREMGWRLANA